MSRRWVGPEAIAEVAERVEQAIPLIDSGAYPGETIELLRQALRWLVGE